MNGKTTTPRPAPKRGKKRVLDSLPANVVPFAPKASQAAQKASHREVIVLFQKQLDEMLGTCIAMQQTARGINACGDVQDAVRTAYRAVYLSLLDIEEYLSSTKGAKA